MFVGTSSSLGHGAINGTGTFSNGSTSINVSGSGNSSVSKHNGNEIIRCKHNTFCGLYCVDTLSSSGGGIGSGTATGSDGSVSLSAGGSSGSNITNGNETIEIKKQFLFYVACVFLR